jgi:hypothetical protein
MAEGSPSPKATMSVPRTTDDVWRCRGKFRMATALASPTNRAQISRISQQHGDRDRGSRQRCLNANARLPSTTHRRSRENVRGHLLRQAAGWQEVAAYRR